MAGGPTTPQLVAAVASAGGLGSFGLAYSTPEQIHTQCEAFKDLCQGQTPAWNANFFVFPTFEDPSDADLASALGALESLAKRATVDLSSDAGALESRRAQLKRPPDLAQQLEAVLQYKPALVSMHLGIPSDEIIAMVRSAGCALAFSATSLEEGLKVEEAGADFIVAQGFEAGGHRGVFDPSGLDAELGIKDLVVQLSSECQLPVIASGGIMNGADIVAIRRAGADAVQMGSAFLTVDESGVCQTYREAIATMMERETRMTRGFSGRSARGISNLFIESTKGAPVLPFPVQNFLTASLRKAAGAACDYELMSLWAGTNYRQARNCSAASLIQELQREFDQALSL